MCTALYVCCYCYLLPLGPPPPPPPLYMHMPQSSYLPLDQASAWRLNGAEVLLQEKPTIVKLGQTDFFYLISMYMERDTNWYRK